MREQCGIAHLPLKYCQMDSLIKHSGLQKKLHKEGEKLLFVILRYGCFFQRNKEACEVFLYESVIFMYLRTPRKLFFTFTN